MDSGICVCVCQCCFGTFCLEGMVVVVASGEGALEGEGFEVRAMMGVWDTVGEDVKAGHKGFLPVRLSPCDKAESPGSDKLFELTIRLVGHKMNRDSIEAERVLTYIGEDVHVNIAIVDPNFDKRHFPIFRVINEVPIPKLILHLGNPAAGHSHIRLQEHTMILIHLLQSVLALLLKGPIGRCVSSVDVIGTLTQRHDAFVCVRPDVFRGARCFAFTGNH